MADPDVADATARSFLGQLPSELVALLLGEGERTDYPAGTTVYREGGPPRAVLVVAGLLFLYMTSVEGRQVTVHYARDADVMGIAVLVGGPVNVAVQALAPSTRFRLDGIREFVVGTGGKTHHGFRTIRGNSQVRNTGTFGVVRLALHPNGYDWRFLPEPGKHFSDAVHGTCH